MSPTVFPEANTVFGPPSDLEESQCASIPAYVGEAKGGSVDGSKVVVVAWYPTPNERDLIQHGAPIFITMMGGLAPHFLTVSFNEATLPA